MTRKDLEFEKLGAKIYYTYRFFKFLIFLLNIYMVYNFFYDKPSLLVLSLVLNIIYILIYVRRLYLSIIGIGICYLISQNVFLSICTGFSIGNGISYIFDFIYIRFTSFIIRIMQKAERK